MTGSAPEADPLGTAAAATMLLFYLRKSGYFGSESGRDRELSASERLVGRLLHRLVLVSERNTHQFSEIDSYTANEGAKLAPLGCCVNPTLALLNHSCDPNTARVNVGARTFLVATKRVTRGQEITDSYSVHFQDAPLQARAEFQKKTAL